jgi:hypothetical protein
MSLVLGAPLALFALLALAVPLILHLDRRRTPRRLPFPALRWLGRAQPARRSARLTEWLLLALRLALLLVLVLWLAAPALQGWAGSARHWVAVAPGVSGQAAATIAPDPAQALWLTEGFPALQEPSPVAAGDMASLLRELDARLAADDTLTVVVPRELGGLDAAAIGLSRRVQWRVVDGASPRAATPPARSRHLAVRHAAEAEPALRWVRAAAAAWNAADADAVVLDVAPIGTQLPQRVDALLWIGAVPDAQAVQRVQAGAWLLQVASQTASGAASGDDTWQPAARRIGQGWHRISDRAFDPASLPLLHEPTFPNRLHALLFGEPAAPDRARAEDVRPHLVQRQSTPPAMPLRPWLGWLAACLFLLERVLANGRRLAGAA